MTDRRADLFVDELVPESGDRARLRAVLEEVTDKARRGSLLVPSDVRGWYERLHPSSAASARPDWERVAGLLAALRERLLPLLSQSPSGPDDFMARVRRRPSSAADIASSMAETYLAGSEAGLPAALLRLLAGYVAMFCAAPLPVFPRAEEPALADALEGGLGRLRVYMADKLQEAVYAPSGEVLERTAQHIETSSYGVPGARELLVDWTELHAAQRRWRDESG